MTSTSTPTVVRGPAAGSGSLHTPTPTGGGPLAGLGTLIRFDLRMDRIRIPVWIAALVLMTIASASGFPDIYPTPEARQSRAALMTSPAAVAMSGPGYGVEDYTFGAMLANELLGFLAIFVALMTVLTVVRHTRNEEEAGRAELVRAGVVGRHAALTAALIVAVGTNLVLAGAFTVSLAGLGLESVTWGGSLAFGAALASVGIVYAAIAAVSAQIFEHGRAASGMAGAMIGLAFALRAVGDMSDGTLSWLSPIGWAQQARVFVDERWWPLLLALTVACALTAVAYALSTRRDVGAGLRQPKAGPATASAALSGPLGLAFRLHRGSVLTWTLALFAFGAMYGSLAAEVERFVEENPALRKFIEQSGGASFLDSWLSMIISMLALVATVFAILVVVRMRAEETSGRAEPVLATGVGRYRWIGAHLTVALVGGALVLFASALGLGLTAAASTGDPALTGRLVVASLVYVPALWLCTAVAAALFGQFPRGLHLAWIVLVYGLLAGMLGGLLQLPSWLLDLSPFTQTPQLPAAEFEVLPVAVIALIAALLLAAGVAAFRQRDLDSV